MLQNRIVLNREQEVHELYLINIWGGRDPNLRLIVIATLFRVYLMEETRKDNFNCAGPLQYQSQTSRKLVNL